MKRGKTPTDNGYAERFVGIFKHSVVHRYVYKNLTGFAEPQKYKPVLKDAIYDLKLVKSAKNKNKTNGDDLKTPNHEYMTGGFSSIYMSRNRVRSWDEPSFIIQAGGRHAPIHPQAPKMKFIEQNKRIFVPKKEGSISPFISSGMCKNSNISR